MDTLAIIEVLRNAVWVLLKISIPILLVALFVGFIISLLQALTQIQEPTLSFVPKIIAVFFALLLYIPYIGSIMQKFSDELMSLLININ
jgi:flagellar biosynthetic protein FliQ